MSRRGAIAELAAAGCALLGCVLAWVNASSDVVNGPILDGEPSTVSQVYYAPMLTLSLMLAALAGVLLVLGVAHLRRGNRGSVPTVAGSTPA